jgi:hypothetical protein
MGGLRGRLRRIETQAERLHAVLRLPDGTTMLYTPEEAWDATSAAIHGTDHPLLARFLMAGTTEGLPGLCRALVWSREGG